MVTTIVDPRDGRAYDLMPVGGRWDIRETGTGKKPTELAGEGPWTSAEQALAALQEVCGQQQGDDGAKVW